MIRNDKETSARREYVNLRDHRKRATPVDLARERSLYRLIRFGTRLSEGWVKSFSGRCTGRSSSAVSRVTVVKESIWIDPYGSSSATTVCSLCKPGDATL